MLLRCWLAASTSIHVRVRIEFMKDKDLCEVVRTYVAKQPRESLLSDTLPACVLPEKWDAARLTSNTLCLSILLQDDEVRAVG